MPRLSHALPKYRKHRGSGQAVVTLNGRDRYLGPYGTKASKREYDRLTGEWLANGRYPPILGYHRFGHRRKVMKPRHVVLIRSSVTI